MSDHTPVRRNPRIRDFFWRSKTQAEVTDSSTELTNLSLSRPAVAASTFRTSIPPPLPPRNSPKDVYEAALALLGDEDRSLIKKHTHACYGHVRVDLQNAWTAANESKKSLTETRSFNKARKVALWLERFKSFGNVAANACPLYAGLPWSGIRFLLEVSCDLDVLLTACESVQTVPSAT